MVPEKFSNQRPPLHVGENGPSTPPGSPPHDAYESHSPIEGEGEAAFTGNRPASPSPPRSPRKMIDLLSSRQKRALPEPPLGAREETKRKLAPPEGAAKPLDSKSKVKPKPPSAPSSPQPQRPPPSRPPPPRRQSSTAPRPRPPPKPTQTHKPKPPMPQKPAPPKRQKSNESSLQQPHKNPAQKHTPQKPEISKPVHQSSTTKNSEGESPPTPTPTGATNNSQQPQQDIATQLQNPSVKPRLKLREGWICVWSKSQKRWYFFDTKTNKSVWDPEQVKAAL